jgi:transposase
MIKYSEEFKQEAVRIALTSGLPRARVASDLGVGKSTLGKWVSEYHPTDLVAALQADLAHENERLRLENRILKEEREILKKHVLSLPKGLPSSSRASAREVHVRGKLASPLASKDALSCHACQSAWLSFLAVTVDQPSGSHGHESVGVYPGTISLKPWQLWPPSDDAKGIVGHSKRSVLMSASAVSVA